MCSETDAEVEAFNEEGEESEESIAADDAEEEEENVSVGRRWLRSHRNPWDNPVHDNIAMAWTVVGQPDVSLHPQSGPWERALLSGSSCPGMARVFRDDSHVRSMARCRRFPWKG